MCLAQGHNKWRRWGLNPRSRVKHSTTEPLRSLMDYTIHIDSSMELSILYLKGLLVKISKQW